MILEVFSKLNDSMICYHRVGMCLELALLSEMSLVVKDNKGKTLLDDVREMRLELHTEARLQILHIYAITCLEDVVVIFKS